MGARLRPGTCPLRTHLAISIAAVGALLFCAGAPSESVASEQAVTMSTAGSSEWPQFQGGPEHLGTLDSSTLVPPLRRVWRFDAPEKERGLSPPVIHGGLVIAVGREGVYAVHIEDGTLAWQLSRAGGMSTPAPAIADAGHRTVLLFTDGERAKDSRLRAYDVETQKHLWDVPLDDVSTSGVSVDGDRAFVGDRSGTLYAVDVRSGRVRWKFRGGGVIDAPVAAARGRVYVVTANRSTNEVDLVSVSENNGKSEWTFSPVQLATFGTSAAVEGESVFIGLRDRALYSADVRTGTEQWSAQVASAFSPIAGTATRGDLVVAGWTL